MQRGVANEVNRIVQSPGEHRGRSLVGVVVQEEQALPAGERVRVVKGRACKSASGAFFTTLDFCLAVAEKNRFKYGPAECHASLTVSSPSAGPVMNQT